MNLKHLKRLFKNACGSKKGYRPILQAVQFKDGTVTACDSYKLYQVKTPYAKALEGKLLKPTSNALQMNFLIDTETFDSPDFPKNSLEFEPGQYPNIEVAKPDNDKNQFTKLLINKKQLIDLLNCYESEVLELNICSNLVNAPLLIKSADNANEYGLLMPRKK